MTFNTKAFSAAQQQGVLVITPLGDSLSFRDVDVQREGVEIKDYLSSNQVTQLIVDLGRSHYFGSLMIGIINSLGQTVRQNGGQMVMCNASDEMQTILKVMKLDTLWPMIPTLPQAIKVVKTWKQ